MKLTPSNIVRQIGPDLWEDEQRDLVSKKTNLGMGILCNIDRPTVVKVFEELKAAQRPVDPNWMKDLGQDDDGKIMAVRAPAAYAYFLIGHEALRLAKLLNEGDSPQEVTPKKFKKKHGKNLPTNVIIKGNGSKFQVTREAKNKDVETYFDTLVGHLLYRDSLLEPNELHLIFFID